MRLNPATTRIVTAAFLLVLLNAASVTAMCMTDGQGPCYRFWRVDAVFVAKVLVKEPVPHTDPDLAGYMPFNARLEVVVAEAFRGVVLGARLTLYAPDDVCAGISATDGGELFIYASRNKQGELWAQGCGVSRPLAAAAADLDYARSVHGQGPAARVYGDVVQHEELYGDYRDFTSLEGVRVRVVGTNFTAETLTDKEGNYEITLPGAGNYRIEALAPDGLADRLYGAAGASFEIRDRRECASISFQLRSNGRIRGRVIDADDKPVPDLVMSAQQVANHGYEYFDKTDESGMFDIGPLTEGVYQISPQATLEVEMPATVRVRAGQSLALEPLIAHLTDDFVRLSIEVMGDYTGDVYVDVSNADGLSLSDAKPANGRTVRFLVEKNRSFTIRASSSTHEAETVVRSSSTPETKVTLTLRPQQQ